MNCRDLARLVESRRFESLNAAERHECEAHARSCRHCAPVWVGYARLAAIRIPPMPPDLAARCKALAAARAQGSVLRFARRGVVIAAGGFVVLAAAAGAFTVHLLNSPAPAPEEALPLLPAATVSPAVSPMDHVENGDPDMNKSMSITAAAIALGVASNVQAQTAPAAEEPRRRTAEEIIAANDLNKDGIVTRDEAAKVNGNLYVMWDAVYDLDRDGRLDVVELKRAMLEVEVGTAVDKMTGNSGGNMAAARPEAILASNDLNKDGVVTKEEAKTAGRALIRMWDSYDLNKDGIVELSELAKAQGY